MAEAETYTYQALPDRRWIRLVRLDGAAAGDLNLVLSSFPIDEAPNYDALSYTWGAAVREYPYAEPISDTAPKPTIKIGTSATNVGQNLHDAILAWHNLSAREGASQQQGDKWLWADAICINQSDIPEKSAQVALMGKIYSSAQRVVVWLGSDTNDLDDFQWIHTHFWDYYEPNYPRLYGTQPPFLDESILSAVGQTQAEWCSRWASYARFYCRRRWFSRIWIMQECTCAREITVLCGSTELLWDRLVTMSDVTVITWWGPSILQNFIESESRNRQANREDIEATAKYLMTAAGATFDACRRTTRGLDKYVSTLFVQPFDETSPLRLWLGCLSFLWSRTGNSGCSLPHDKIFAVLGIAQKFLPPGKPSPIVPRYDQAVESVYAEVTSLMLQHSPSPEALWWVQNPVCKKLAGLPSWCPDRSISANFIPLTWTGASAGYSPGCEDWRLYGRVSGNELQLRGYMVDAIADASPLGDKFDLSLMEAFCLHLSPIYEPTKQDRVEVYWRTLLFDFDLSTGVGQHPVPDDMASKFKHWVLYDMAHSYLQYQENSEAQERLLGRYSSILDRLQTRNLPSTSEIKRFAIGKVKREEGGQGSSRPEMEHSKRDKDDFGGVEAGWRRFHRQMTAYNKGYDIFLTHNGYIGGGLSPLATGDQVWLLHGIGVPFILRPIQRNRHQLIGNALQEPAAIFAAVSQEFKKSLPEKAWKRIDAYQDANAMLEGTTDLLNHHSTRPSKLRVWLAAVDRIASRLRPYFKVVDVLVQSNPEYAALVWGTLRTIFQMASNFTTLFEKIENMLLRMTSTLPDFTMFLEVIARRTSQQAAAAFPRLVKALGYIYGDILEFCHRVCKLLSGSEIVSRIKFFGKMAFIPFETHFQEIIEKFELHSQLFAFHMQTVSNEEAIKFYSQWDAWEAKATSAMNRLLGMDAPAGENSSSLGPEHLGYEVDKLIKRIHAPAWAPVFEHARSRRGAHSGEWLLNHPVFDKFWRNSDAELEHNMLFIRGKPGYGKTTLATLMVDHLKSYSAASPRSGVNLVVYYFFDRRNQMSQSNNGSDAIRALASQVIFFRRHDPMVLDIASLVRPWHDTGQQFASDDEVLAMLQLNLLHAPNCMMVCDGIDESADPERFLRHVESLAAENKKSRFILFGRPILKLHPSLFDQSQLLSLEPTQNLDDLKQFIEPKIEELLDARELILPQGVTIPHVVDKISRQASGMFLWTRLFMKFLESPSLSLSARWKIIQDPTGFGGLHNMFQAIFEKIENDYQGPARVNIRRAFQWVLGASRPLHVNELRVAIGQELDRAFDETDAIPNFEEALGAMTGALLEITEYKTVRLIHHTVADFLVSELCRPAASPVGENLRDFRPLVIQQYISSACLAFLTFTMPKGPYRKPFALSSVFPSVRRKLPLINYVTRYWIAQVVRFSEELRLAPQRDTYHDAAQEIGEKCIALIRDREKFTSWAECMWHTQCEETVWPSEDQMIDNIRLNLDGSALAEAFSLIRWAYVEHNRIPNAWRNELEQHPEKIWLPSLPALSNAKLVGDASGASISPIVERHALGYSSIVILTQMSATGHAIGIISIKPPSGRDKISKKDPSVMATYRIHALDFDDVLFETTVEVELDATRKVSEDGSFSIDASISEGLSEIVVENVLVKLSIQGDADGFTFQQTAKVELDILKHHRSFYSKSHLKRNIVLSYGAEFLVIMQQVQGSCGWIFDVYQDSNCKRDPSSPSYVRKGHKTSHAMGSVNLLCENPYGLMASFAESNGRQRIERPKNMLNSPKRKRGRPGTPPDEPRLADQVRNLASHSPIPEGSMDGPRMEPQPTVHFHPKKRLLMLVEPGGTFVWNFSRSRSSDTLVKPVLAHKAALEKPGFSDGGNLFYGLERRTKDLVLLDLERHCRQGRELTASQVPGLLTTPDTLVQIHTKSSLVESIPSQIQRVQASDSALIAKDSDGIPTLSVVHYHPEDASLVQATLNSVGTLTSRKLMDLPRGLVEHANLALLYPWTGPEIFAHGGNRKVVMGVSLRESYTFGEEETAESRISLPAVFERQSSSINTLQSFGHVLGVSRLGLEERANVSATSSIWGGARGAFQSDFR
ncbi:hypothetical protein ACJZ2D_016563 [Fusarium nematophilum]